MEPVELLEKGGDVVVVVVGRSGDNMGCRVLDQLKLMEGLVIATKYTLTLEIAFCLSISSCKNDNVTPTGH